MKARSQEVVCSPAVKFLPEHPPSTHNKPTLLRRIEVQDRLSISRAALYAKLNPSDPSHDPAFPIPIRIGQRAVRWIESEVDAYIAALPRTRCLIGGVQ